MRFTILHLAGLASLVGLTCAALPNASSLWRPLISLLAWLLLVVCTYGAVFYRGPSRTAWAGAALAGCGYFVLAFASEVSEAVPSVAFFDFLYPSISRQVATSSLSVDVPNGTPAGPRVNGELQFTIPFVPHFRQVGHALSAMFCCLLGAILAQYFRHISDDQQSDQRRT